MGIKDQTVHKAQILRTVSWFMPLSGHRKRTGDFITYFKMMHDSVLENYLSVACEQLKGHKTIGRSGRS